jgi:hypothetical protein
MSFDPCNYLLKIWESIRTLIPKMGAHLGVWGFITSDFPRLLGAWNVTPNFHSWPTPLQALALVTSPRLGLWQWEIPLFFCEIRNPYLIGCLLVNISQMRSLVQVPRLFLHWTLMLITLIWIICMLHDSWGFLVKVYFVNYTCIPLFFKIM